MRCSRCIGERSYYQDFGSAKYYTLHLHLWQEAVFVIQQCTKAAAELRLGWAFH